MKVVQEPVALVCHFSPLEGTRHLCHYPASNSLGPLQ